ncbi:probable nucleoporin Nup54 [Condylostylus longicornis]|uniref:probable nucleoporin Nup54 n=1 Tax=Condylostylus longicornis TaxID=2530218 RepID=UPI00244DB675|nr:probable nucleoporin Nup54 [Condylostylus longicornis]
MAFNFGNTTGGLGASSTPAKPAFGNFSFGQATTSAPAFGTQNTAPTFGTPNFGTGTQNTSAPAFGSTSFGAQPNPAPAFGTNTAVASTFTPAPAFGAGSVFGATTSAPSLGGFGGFGTNTATTSAPSLFGGLGSTPANTGFAGFGATTTTTSAPTFTGFGASNTGFGSFGSTFGSTFGKPATSTAPAFGGFGTTFGAQQNQQQPWQIPQQQQAQSLNPDEAFAQSILNVTIYGDERDTILAKWNYLQAMWGTGKAFYSNNAPHFVEITPQNYLCRFKTIGYSRKPGKDNKLGLVALVINKPESEIKNQQQQLITSLNQILGNKPNLTVKFDSIKQLEEKTQIMIYVEEKTQQIPNQTKRILASELSNFLNQPNIKQQLTNLGVESALAHITPDDDQIKEYIEVPPKGIDPRMWRQANIDNPDSKKFIQVPMVGFNDLKWRLKCQENETDLHIQCLAKLEKDLAEVKQRHASSTAKIMEYRRKLAELSHKILKIVVKQECSRKVGMPLSPEEEILRGKLENMQSLVSAPTQFKGRLSELLSQMRMQRNQYTIGANKEYTLDRDSEDEMKAFLTMQQNAMKLLIDTVNKDLKALNIITEGMNQLTHC